MFETLGRFIRLTRLQRSLTQERLAELADVSRWQLAQLEKGENVSVEFLVKVARALEVTEVPVDFLTLHPVTPDTSALLIAAEAMELARTALAQTEEASKDLARAAASVDGLLARAAVPSAASQRIADAADRLVSAPVERAEKIGHALRENVETSGRRARVSRSQHGATARRRAR